MNPVSCAKHEVAVRNKDIVFPLNCTDQELGFHLFVHFLQADIIERRNFRQTIFHQFQPALFEYLYLCR